MRWCVVFFFVGVLYKYLSHSHFTMNDYCRVFVARRLSLLVCLVLMTTITMAPRALLVASAASTNDPEFKVEDGNLHLNVPGDKDIILFRGDVSVSASQIETISDKVTDLSRDGAEIKTAVNGIKPTVSALESDLDKVKVSEVHCFIIWGYIVIEREERERESKGEKEGGREGGREKMDKTSVSAVTYFSLISVLILCAAALLFHVFHPPPPAPQVMTCLFTSISPPSPLPAL